MRIIHFSDAHFQPGNAINKYQRLADYFIDSLKSIHQQKNIDLIIFSGDMIDRGGKGFTSMSDAFMEFVLEMRKDMFYGKTKLTKRDILLNLTQSEEEAMKVLDK